MFAILQKTDNSVVIINIADSVDMPALFVVHDQAMQTLYKNNMHDLCYVAEVFPQVFLEPPTEQTEQVKK